MKIFFEDNIHSILIDEKSSIRIGHVFRDEGGNFQFEKCNNYHLQGHCHKLQKFLSKSRRSSKRRQLKKSWNCSFMAAQEDS